MPSNPHSDEGPWIVEGHSAPGDPADPTTAGERKLVRELLSDAIREAMMPPCETRDEARAWLADTPKFTAKFCCESLGLDYDAVIAALHRKWTEADAFREARTAARRQQIH